MAKPVITAPISPRIIAQGVAFSQTMAASGTPTSWAATGLPSGLSIHATTGTISGTPLVQVQTTASITATNGDGTSDAVVIIFVVMATPPGMGGPFDIVLDYEMTTNEVTMPGVPAPLPGQPLFWAPRGTNRHILLGVTYFGVLQDINPADETVAMKLGMKQFETERLIEETVGATVKVADMPDDRQRYRIPFRVTPSKWTGALSDNENDAGTEVLSLSEIQVLRGTASELHDATLTDSDIAIQGNVTIPITGDHDFTGVEEFAVSTPMRLTLTLSVTGRVLQTVSLVRTFDAIFTGGSFALSNFSGPTTGTGAIEEGKWRATLSLSTLTGDANSIDADYSIVTSADGVDPYAYFILGDWTDTPGSIASTRQLRLYEGTIETPTTIGSLMSFSSGATAAEMAATIASAWQAETGVADVVEVVYTESPLVFKVRLTDTSPVIGIEWKETIVGSDLTEPTAGSLIGPPSTCSVTAQLEQLEAPTSIPLNLTSNQFLIGVARDIVTD